jgi:predicted ATPase with chaperone activity
MTTTAVTLRFVLALRCLKRSTTNLLFFPIESDDDFAECHSQQRVKRAVEVAAARAHSLQ